MVYQQGGSPEYNKKVAMIQGNISNLTEISYQSYNSHH